MAPAERPPIRRRLTALAGTAVLILAASVRAEILRVVPGDEWSALALTAKPGDEIVLGEGVHRPAVLEGLAGAPDAPIVIRPEKAGALVEIDATREAIKLVGARHVRVERILVKQARRAGIVVEGTPDAPCEDIELADILVLGAKGLAEEAGIVAREVRGLGIRRSRVESCAGSGIHLAAVESGVIERCQVIARAAQPMATGLRLDEGVRDLVVERVVFGTEIGSAFVIGVPTRPGAANGDTPSAPTETVTPPESGAPRRRPSRADTPEPPAAVERVRITDCKAVRVDTLLTVGSARGVVLRNTTLLEPHGAVYRIVAHAEDSAGAGVRFSDNLVLWEPGRLHRIARVAEGVNPAPFTLGVNLWWSKELPAALPALTDGGEPDSPAFPGTLDAPQRLDIDPDLDTKGYPTNEAAKPFGISPA